jgi:hypothetical protein
MSSGSFCEVSVKGVRNGSGKWGVTSADESNERRRIYVFLIYVDFDDLESRPTAYVIPAPRVQQMKRPWHTGVAVYYSSRANRPPDLDLYHEDTGAWRKYFK